MYETHEEFSERMSRARTKIDRAVGSFMAELIESNITAEYWGLVQDALNKELER